MPINGVVAGGRPSLMRVSADTWSFSQVCCEFLQNFSVDPFNGSALFSLTGTPASSDGC